MLRVIVLHACVFTTSALSCAQVKVAFNEVGCCNATYPETKPTGLHKGCTRMQPLIDLSGELAIAPIEGTAANFANLVSKPQMCVKLTAASDVGSVQLIPRQMAFLDATTKALRLDLYDSAGLLVAYEEKLDVAYLRTDLSGDPFGRAPTGPVTVISVLAVDVRKICVTITEIHDYEPPVQLFGDLATTGYVGYVLPALDASDFTAWGCPSCNPGTATSGYVGYVQRGTWNVGLVSFGIYDTHGAQLAQSIVLGEHEIDPQDNTISWTDGDVHLYDSYYVGSVKDSGYSPYNALKNGYGLEYYEGTSTAKSWSWSGEGTVSKGTMPNQLYGGCYESL